MNGIVRERPMRTGAKLARKPAISASEPLLFAPLRYLKIQ